MVGVDVTYEQLAGHQVLERGDGRGSWGAAVELRLFVVVRRRQSGGDGVSFIHFLQLFLLELTSVVASGSSNFSDYRALAL